MNNSCGVCKYGNDTKPGGQKVSPGTVWCSHRSIQMARNRQMPCFAPVGGKKVPHCIECKKAKMAKPSGDVPQIGHIWCEKRHFEINKQRSMDCFE